MFENYPEYLHDVLEAAKSMPQPRKTRLRKIAAASLASVFVAGGIIVTGNSAVAHAKVREAIESVSNDISSQTVQVEVEDAADSSIAYLLSDDPNTLSATDEAAISEQIKTTITEDSLANAAGKIKDNETIEVDILTAESIPVTVTIKKHDEGYTIEKIVAKLDAATADEKKKQVSNAISADVQKQANEIDLGAFVDRFAQTAGIAEDADDETRAAAYDANMKVLADNLVMAIPSGYELQEEGAGTADDATASEEGTAPASSDKPEEKLAADSVKPYAFSYKDGSGSSLSVRAENLGAAFTQMNGPDGANKMMGYWQETANNVAAGAGQHLKDEAVGFDTKLFYDKQSGMWGYFGHVEFTDGSRDVIYNRVVFVDELADQMITISYRHDSEVDGGSGMDMETFKALFMHAPTPQDGTTVGVVGAVGDDPLAVDAYKAKLRLIQILPGETMTEPDKEAAEEAARAAADAEKTEADGNGDADSGDRSEESAE